MPQVDIAGLIEFLADGTDMPERSQLAARGEYDEAIRPRARLADEERMGDVHVGPRRVMRAIAFAAHLEPDQREIKRDGIDGAMRPAEQTGAAAPHPPEFLVLAGCVDDALAYFKGVAVIKVTSEKTDRGSVFFQFYTSLKELSTPLKLKIR